MRISISVCLTLLIFGTAAHGHPTYAGYSGAPGAQGTCSGSCHGGTGGTISASGFPADYVPGRTYVVTVWHSGGAIINNFNASVRIGGGSQTAGLITAGVNTEVYNVPGETNGVHFATANHSSGTFNWTAPDPPVGQVKLYLAGHQDSTISGHNTELVLSSNPVPYEGELLIPNGDECWAGGDSQTLVWTVTPRDYFYTKLLLSTDGGANWPEVVAPSVAPNDTTFRWGIPQYDQAACRVRVQAYDSTDELVFEDASDGDFTIDSQDPSVPLLIFPPAGGATNNPAVVFRWHRASDNLSGIDYHTIQIAYDSMFGALVDTARRTDTTYARLLPADTSYYWRVRGTDRCGNVGPWSQKWKFEIDVQTPEVPTPLQPVAGEWFRSSTVQFHWTPVSFRAPVLSAVRYIIQLDTIQNIRPLYTDTATAVYDTFSFLAEHRYWWRVRAYDLAGNQGAFSANQGFGVDMTGPLIPSLVYPPHLGAITTDTTSLIWHVSRDYTSGTELYHVQLAHDSSFTDTIALTPGPTLPDTAAAASLPSMTDYYWRVRARDTAGNWCNWSLVRQFTYGVGVAEQPDKLPSVAYMECQPNPSGGRTTVRVALPSPTNVSVAVYDAVGVKVGTLWNGRLPAGRHSFNWDARTSSGREVVPGVYFARATAAQWSRVTSVRVVR